MTDVQEPLLIFTLEKARIFLGRHHTKYFGLVMAELEVILTY
jgi:hypothetical protein